MHRPCNSCMAKVTKVNAIVEAPKIAGKVFLIEMG
jgi:hypothetical protein